MATTQEIQSGNNDVRLYVTGLPLEITLASLKNIFHECGTITDIKLLPKKSNVFSTKAGFVCFASDKEATCAISRLNGIKVGSHYLNIKYSNRKFFDKGNFNSSYQKLLNKLEEGPLNDDDVKLLVKPIQNCVAKKVDCTQNEISCYSNKHNGSLTKSHRNFNLKCCSKDETSPKNIFSKRKKDGSLFTKKITSYGDAFDCEIEKNNFRNNTVKKFHNSCFGYVHCDSGLSNGNLIALTNSKLNYQLDCAGLDASVTDISKAKKFIIPKFLPNIKAGTVLNVLVVDININKAEITCQMADLELMDSLLKLQTALNDHLFKEKRRLEFPSVGDSCAALFSEDGQWYRAIIEKFLENQNLQVLFIDYGNRDIVSCNNILWLNKNFCEHPAFSFVCKFAETNLHSLSEKQVEVFSNILQSNEMLLQIKSTKVSSNFLYAAFFADNISINDVLCNISPRLQKHDISFYSKNISQDLSTIEGHINKMQSDEYVTCNLTTTLPKNFIPKGKFKFVISNVINPNSFYCQIIRGDLIALNELLQSLTVWMDCNPHINDFQPESGSTCAAIFEVDGLWYRAQILKSLPKDRYKVYYVDFGNTCILEKSKIQPLPKQFTTLPVQAFHASLANCCPKNNIWCNEAIDYMKSLQMDQSLNGEIAEIENAYLNYVAIPMIAYINKMELNSYFISKGYAIKKPPSDNVEKISKDLVLKSIDFSSTSILKNSDEQLTVITSDEQLKEIDKEPQSNLPVCSVFSTTNTSLQLFTPILNNKIKISITCSNKFGVFYCHVVDDHLNALCDVVSKLTLYAIKNPCFLKHPLVPGMLCAAYCEDDQTWCRAIILTCSLNNIKVIFVDYGNCEVVNPSEILFLPDEFTRLPALALPCMLANIKPIGAEWDYKLSQIFNKCIGKKLDAVFIEKTKNNEYLVQIPFLINTLIKASVGVFCLDSHFNQSLEL